MSLGQSMNIALGSLKNNQYALTVVAQNIANLNTDGYVKQRVNFETNNYSNQAHDVISTIKGMNGASISSLSGYVDDAVYKDLIDKNADASYYNNLSDALGELEDIADALGDNGLNSILNDFYAASANLEKYPTDMSIRQQFVAAAQNVSDKFNELSARYDGVRDEKINTIEYDVGRMNTLFNTLAQANQQYLDSGSDSSAQNNINSVLKELSNYSNITSTKNSNGTVNVSIGNIQVVSGTKVEYTLGATVDTTSTNPVTLKLISTEDPDKIITNGVNESFTSGSMRANLEIVNGTGGKFSNVNDMKASLDNAAAAFADAVNSIQTYGYGGGDVFAAYITTDDTTGDLILKRATQDDKIFTTTDDTGTYSASTIRINDAVLSNPFLVSAARIDLSKYQDENGVQIEDWTKAIGNSDNAVEFTKLSSAKICRYGDSGPNNCTISDYLMYNATKASTEASNTTSQAKTYQDIADDAVNNYLNLVGVNVDEELSDMIRYQRAYEASAKLFSIIDNITATIINMV